MTIKEDIKYYTDGLNNTPEKAIKFAMFNYLKMYSQTNNIRRYISKELKGNKNLQFNSQDLRSYAMSLDNILKILNKKCNFKEIEKRIVKEFEKAKKKDANIKAINYNMVFEECKNTGIYGKIAQYIEAISISTHHYALLVYLIEQEYLYKKMDSDSTLQKTIEEAINELLNN